MAKKEEAFIKIPEKWFILTLKDNIKLNYGALIVLAKIDSLINNKYPSCIASNEYFADLIKVSVRTISDHISRLQSNGIITVEMKKRGMKETTRCINVNHNKIAELIGEEVHDQMCNGNANTPPEQRKNGAEGLEQQCTGTGGLSSEQWKKGVKGLDDSCNEIERIDRLELGNHLSKKEENTKKETSRDIEKEVSPTAALGNSPHPSLMNTTTELESISEELKDKVMDLFAQRCKYDVIKKCTGLSYEIIGAIIDQRPAAKKKAKKNGTDKSNVFYRTDGTKVENFNGVIVYDIEPGEYVSKDMREKVDKEISATFPDYINPLGDYGVDFEQMKDWFIENYGWTPTQEIYKYKDENYPWEAPEKETGWWVSGDFKEYNSLFES